MNYSHECQQLGLPVPGSVPREAHSDTRSRAGGGGREGTWYDEGPPALRAARRAIARYSLPRAKERLKKAREELQQPGSARAAARQEAQRRAAAMGIYCSQIGDTRPISFCRFSDDSKMLITSSWSGLVKVWSVPECRQLHTLRAHTCNVSAAVFRPGVQAPHHFSDKLKEESTDGATTPQDGGAMEVEVESSARECAMASCAYDGSVHLWNFASDQPMASLAGHSPHRVARVEFHPSGRFLATTVFDHSWRLWDLESGKEVLHQEGHTKPVYCVAFQVDGSLAITGSMDAFGRVWDLRTGRCVMLLAGHGGAVLGAAGAPGGALVATAAADHTARVWDLRARRCVYTLPAHTSTVTDIRYQRSHGHFLLTASYDQSAKLWSSPAHHPLRTLSGHDNKVMSADISFDNKYIATSSYDRTFKLWAPDLA
ncbi:hypothetical protein JYU34_018116 [Plutella xylostella]|uniref:WD repeat-containing protein 55 homolog n=1 Tax=Plutella xylostella TaxID=51655 RepID=A0ABQ7Q007_PLUXY|nr:hypothetical protein JYU34_018116 [Plutella xylostella]